MKTLILGPTKTVLVDAPLQDTIRRLGAWADAPGCPFTAHHRTAHFQIAPRPAQRRVWSPHLTIDIREAPEPLMPTGPDGVAPTDAALGQVPRTEVFGRFNPSPAIWTGYMLTTLALLTIIVSALVWGGAQVQIGQAPTAWWAIPVAVVILIAMWSASAVGQRLARDQMAAMWADIEGALGAVGSDDGAAGVVGQVGAGAVGGVA